MTQTEKSDSDNVQRQLAIFDVVKRAPGKSHTEIKAMLTEAFEQRGLIPQPGPWLDAVATEAAYGKPYLIDVPSATAANEITTAPDREVQEFLLRRRLFGGSRTRTRQLIWPGRNNSSKGIRAQSPAAAGTDSRDREAQNRYEAIVVGAGFAGTAVAQELGRKGVDVLLIDSNNYHQFQPLLYQLATSQIGVSAIARPLRSMFRRLNSVNVMTATVTAIDPQNRTVTLGDGETLHAQTLVVALGGVPNYFGTPGAEEHAYPLYSLSDATRLATKLTQIFDHADHHQDETVDIVVVGAGPTGVETAGAIAEHIKDVVGKYFSPGLAARSKVHLVDMVPTVLAPFSPNLQEYTKDRLSALGVRLRLGVGVAEVSTNAVKLADGSDIPAQLTVWAGGLKAGEILQNSGLPQGKGGRIDVLPDLTAPDHDNLYVLGDAANITDPEGRKLPQLGSVAQQSGKWAARNIYRDLSGGPREPFHYVDKGYMAMIGRGAAVAEIGRKRIQLHGSVAFLSWLLVHLALLSGAQQKARALFSWLNGYILHSPAQVVVGNKENSPLPPPLDE